MKLTQIEPAFLRYEVRCQVGKFATCGQDHRHTEACFRRRIHGARYYVPVDTLAEAQGVSFLCPRCFTANGGPVGTETVLCWLQGRGIPADATPGPGRWTVTGRDFTDLTLHPSVDVDHGHWHGWVKAGEVA